MKRVLNFRAPGVDMYHVCSEGRAREFTYFRSQIPFLCKGNLYAAHSSSDILMAYKGVFTDDEVEQRDLFRRLHIDSLNPYDLKTLPHVRRTVIDIDWRTHVRMLVELKMTVHPRPYSKETLRLLMSKFLNSASLYQSEVDYVLTKLVSQGYIDALVGTTSGVPLYSYIAKTGGLYDVRGDGDHSYRRGTPTVSAVREQVQQQAWAPVQHRSDDGRTAERKLHGGGLRSREEVDPRSVRPSGSERADGRQDDSGELRVGADGVHPEPAPSSSAVRSGDGDESSHMGNAG